ncbi:MAG: class I SAM-dependent methyltransferase [Candidatus Promineifilaceae bacterium]|nr:class I SAM-dependent methyltransferase [Candidatus Promineifilaceae bacterium]
MTALAQLGDANDLKACCAAVYESDWARLLLGPSLHPGGLSLTRQLGELLDLGPTSRVLDVAAGSGASARFLAETFGCRVVGLDYSDQAVEQANAASAADGLANRVRFRQGDAERLPFDDASFDAILCECAFCTFPDKPTAAAEMARVLRPGGRLGLSDLTRAGSLPPELEGILAWVACIADARPLDDYITLLTEAGLMVDRVQKRDQVLGQTVNALRGRLLGAEMLIKLGQIELPGADFEQAKGIARSATTAISQGQLGYALLWAKRP